jgi:hypothetical protein
VVTGVRHSFDQTASRYQPCRSSSTSVRSLCELSAIQTRYSQLQASMAPQAPLTNAASGQPPLFKGIKYHIAPCIPFKSHENIRKMLNTHGAVEVRETYLLQFAASLADVDYDHIEQSNAINDAEYIFTDSEGFEGANEVSFSAVLVRVRANACFILEDIIQSLYFSPSGLREASQTRPDKSNCSFDTLLAVH